MAEEKDFMDLFYLCINNALVTRSTPETFVAKAFEALSPWMQCPKCKEVNETTLTTYKAKTSDGFGQFICQRSVNPHYIQPWAFSKYLPSTCWDTVIALSPQSITEKVLRMAFPEAMEDLARYEDKGQFTDDSDVEAITPTVAAPSSKQIEQPARYRKTKTVSDESLSALQDELTRKDALIAELRETIATKDAELASLHDFMIETNKKQNDIMIALQQHGITLFSNSSASSQMNNKNNQQPYHPATSTTSKEQQEQQQPNKGTPRAVLSERDQDMPQMNNSQVTLKNDKSNEIEQMKQMVMSLSASVSSLSSAVTEIKTLIHTSHQQTSLNTPVNDPKNITKPIQRTTNDNTAVQSIKQQQTVQWNQSAQKPTTFKEAAATFNPVQKPMTKGFVSSVVKRVVPVESDKLVELHVQGFRRGDRGNIRRVLEQLGIDCNKLRCIDFIGDSLIEFTLYNSYQEEFKRKLSTVDSSSGLFQSCKFTFIEFDPLAITNIKTPKLSATEETARTMYVKRLERKIKHFNVLVKKFPYLLRTLHFFESKLKAVQSTIVQPLSNSVTIIEPETPSGLQEPEALNFPSNVTFKQ